MSPESCACPGKAPPAIAAAPALPAPLPAGARPPSFPASLDCLARVLPPGGRPPGISEQSYGFSRCSGSLHAAGGRGEGGGRLRTRRRGSHARARSGGAGGGGGAPRAGVVAEAPMDGSAPLTLARRRGDAQRSALKATKSLQGLLKTGTQFIRVPAEAARPVAGSNSERFQMFFHLPPFLSLSSLFLRIFSAFS